MDSHDIKGMLSLCHGKQNQRGKWLYFHELRTGTGSKGGRKGYIDGYALNLFPSDGHEAIAYEVKTSRPDFFVDVRNFDKQKYALLFSNYFYFVAPEGLIKPSEVPPYAGLLEVDNGVAIGEGWNLYANIFKVKVQAPWREKHPPSYNFMAAIARARASNSTVSNAR